MTEIAFSSTSVITSDQLSGVRGLRGHLLHTVTCLVTACSRLLHVPGTGPRNR